MTDRLGQARIYCGHWPSTIGCVLSFADGHSELWKWKEARTLEISKMKGWIQGQTGVYGKDRDLGRIYDAIPEIPL